MPKERGGRSRRSGPSPPSARRMPLPWLRSSVPRGTSFAAPPCPLSPWLPRRPTALRCWIWA